MPKSRKKLPTPVRTAEELRGLWEHTSFYDDAPSTWDEIHAERRDPEELREEGGWPEHIYVGECSHLGNTLIALGDSYEQSGEDCFFLQELLRLYAEGRLELRPEPADSANEPYRPSDDLVRLFPDLEAEFLVEATDFEQHTLWRQNRDATVQLPWQPAAAGAVFTAYSGERPITLATLQVLLGGVRVVFWDAPSELVDYAAIKEFFRLQYPRAVQTHAGNFSRVRQFAMDRRAGGGL